jgi:DNA modification methylase
MGNVKDDADFFESYKFLIREKLRVTKPGRLTAVHCSDLPYTKWRDGLTATRAFSDAIRQAHEDVGFHFIRRVTIWRDPVVEMTRTKALNLLYKQLQKDSSKSWPGMADYILLFRAPGENPEPISHERGTSDEISLDQWQKYASPVWMDIQQTNTLNVAMAREGADERHLCPLQLDLIERAIIMWSNPGDVVLSPFAGVGSEGYVALRRGRKFVGVELKESYFRHAARHLAAAEANAADLFTDHAAA